MGDEGTCEGKDVRGEENNQHQITQDTNYWTNHVFNKVLYHVGPVDNCSAISPATQDLSLEHLGVITGMTKPQTQHMSCVFYP